MAEPITFRTVDGGIAWASVTSERGEIRLVVSVERDGDFDVLMDDATARQLAGALSGAAKGENH